MNCKIIQLYYKSSEEAKLLDLQILYMQFFLLAFKLSHFVLDLQNIVSVIKILEKEQLKYYQG